MSTSQKAMSIDLSSVVTKDNIIAVVCLGTFVVNSPKKIMRKYPVVTVLGCTALGITFSKIFDRIIDSNMKPVVVIALLGSAAYGILNRTIWSRPMIRNDDGTMTDPEDNDPTDPLNVLYSSVFGRKQ
jgi:hypothetical protein